jgi:hypothetical protein
MAGKQEPYTQKDFSELSRKLKTLGKDLTPKESAFLTEAVEAAERSIRNPEVQGFGGAYDAKGYTPEQTGAMDTAALPTIGITVKGTFVTK